MGTHMLLFPEQEHLRRVPSWGGMHDPDVGGASGSWMTTPASSSFHHPGTSSGGNTWSKRMASHSGPDSESWEVRAFAEDASSSGQWPPRSYSCSFCQREFRTAQALGGHMNVHRRERAQANQIRTAHSNTDHNTSSPPAHHSSTPDWLPRSSAPESSSYNSPTGDHHSYNYAHDHTSSYSSTPLSFSLSSNSSYEGSNWRSHRDAHVDLELRLGQRYE